MRSVVPNAAPWPRFTDIHTVVSGDSSCDTTAMPSITAMRPKNQPTPSIRDLDRPRSDAFFTGGFGPGRRKELRG
jgi:hypothetical protein